MKPSYCMILWTKGCTQSCLSRMVSGLVEAFYLIFCCSGEEDGNYSTAVLLYHKKGRCSCKEGVSMTVFGEYSMLYFCKKY
jgi:hypothetical protein